MIYLLKKSPNNSKSLYAYIKKEKKLLTERIYYSQVDLIIKTHGVDGQNDDPDDARH